MFRRFIRSVSLNAIALYLSAGILSDFFKISGGTGQLFLAAFVLTVLNITLKPLINLLMLPINLITLNLFRWLSGAAVLFVLTHLVQTVSIQPFTSPAFQVWHVTIPQLTFSGLGVFMLVSVTISFIFQLIHWVFAPD